MCLFLKMIGTKNSPLHKPSSAGPKVYSKANNIPFDSDDESDKKPTQGSLPKPSSAPSKNLPNFRMTNPFDDEIEN